MLHKRKRPAKEQRTQTQRRSWRPGFEELESRLLLSAAPTPFTVPLPDGGANDVTLRREGSDLRIFDTASGATVARRALGDTSALLVLGVDGLNDTLRID